MEITYTQAEISNVAEQILNFSDSKIFLLYGEMGIGKTTLIKSLVKKLGVNEVSKSPSFSIVNEYDSENGVVYHFDFYRINNIEEAYDMGIEEYLYSKKYIFIEWPEKVTALLPTNAINISIRKNNNGSRTIKLLTQN